MATAAPTDIPDPYGWPVGNDPFTALPPPFRRPLLVTITLQCAFAGLTAWDIANSAGFDYRLARKADWRTFRSAITTFSYLSTRWFALGFAIAGICSVTVIQADCSILPRFYTACCVLAIATTSCIFAVRVMALWVYTRPVVIGVALIFVVELGFSSSTLFRTGGEAVPFSPFCFANFAARPYLAGTSGSILLFDTLVAVLTFTKLASRKHLNPLTQAVRDSTPILSKLLIKQGIVYYLLACAINLIATILFAIPLPANEAIYHVFWTIPGLCLQSCIACKVFRLIREELAGPDTAAMQQVSFISGRQQGSGDAASPQLKREYFASRSPEAAFVVPTLRRTDIDFGSSSDDDDDAHTLDERDISTHDVDLEKALASANQSMKSFKTALE